MQAAYKKWVNTFLNHLELLEKIKTLNLICLISNKNRYWKYFTSFALKTNLASLKTEVEKLDIDKLMPVPTDLSKLSNVVKNDVVKRNCIW